MNEADFDLLDRVPSLEARLRALQAELERVVIDNHLLRQEVERLTLKLKPGQETLR
jgi:regulator of replication initiation timing